MSHSEVLVDDILNLSDHNAVRVILEIEKGGCKYTSPVEDFCYNLVREYDVSNMSGEGVDSLVDLLVDALVRTDKQLPRSKYTKHIRPYWNQQLSDMKRDKVIKYRLWKSEGCPRDSESLSWCAHKDSKRKSRHEIKRVQRNFDKDEINRVLKTAECDVNNFWRIVKSHRSNDQPKTFAIRNSAGRT